MKFTQFSAQTDSIYNQLMQQCAAYQQLTASLRKRLPENIAPHCRIACIKQHCLVIYADNNMVANRLKMLLPTILSHWQDLPPQVTQHKVLIAPHNTPQHTHATPMLSETAKQSLHNTAQQLSAHPALSNAFLRFAQVQDR